MASKITGAQLEHDANAPLIDVDTALEDLAEDLQRAGRIRQLHALRHVCGMVSAYRSEIESLHEAIEERDRNTTALKETEKLRQPTQHTQRRTQKP